MDLDIEMLSDWFNRVTLDRFKIKPDNIINTGID
jgi:hypothetical protein